MNNEIMTWDIGKSLGKLGMPVVNVEVGDYMLGFIVDTGSTNCLLDQAVADQLQKQLTGQLTEQSAEQLTGQLAGQNQPLITHIENAECSIMGIDGQPQQNEAVMLCFEFNGQHYNQQFICQPLYDALSSFEQQGYHIHGLLGNDFLTSNHWIIDYQMSTITT